MKKNELSKMKPEDRSKKLSELRSELMILQGQSKTGTPPKNPGQIKAMKRTVAQINTLNNQKKEEK